MTLAVWQYFDAEDAAIGDTDREPFERNFAFDYSYWSFNATDKHFATQVPQAHLKRTVTV